MQKPYWKTVRLFCIKTGSPGVHFQMKKAVLQDTVRLSYGYNNPLT